MIKQVIRTFLLLLPVVASLTGCVAEKNDSPFDAVVAKDGSGDFASIQEAINAVPDSLTSPFVIFVKKGSYEEQVVVPASKSFVHLIGQDKEQTIIHLKLNVGAEPENKDEEFWLTSVHNPESPVHDFEGAVVTVYGPHFYTENISFVNDYGVAAQNGPQALAMKSHADCAAFNNCIFRSFQDTWMTTVKDTDRHYVNNCWIEGAIDYLYGSGDVLVENSTFYNVRSGSVIVAPSHGASKYGYVMRNCVVDGNEAAADGKQLLGRPWHNSPRAQFINTTMLIPIAPEGWTDMGTAPQLFAEYASTDNGGNPLDLSARKTTYKYTTREGESFEGTSRTALSDDEAADMVYEHIIPGADGWDPRRIMAPLPSPSKVSVSSAEVSWEPVPDARGYVVLDDDEVAALTTATACTLPHQPKGKIKVRSVNAYGSLGV